jgi:hypothetical protein
MRGAVTTTGRCPAHPGWYRGALRRLPDALARSSDHRAPRLPPPGGRPGQLSDSRPRPGERRPHRRSARPCRPAPWTLACSAAPGASTAPTWVGNHGARRARRPPTEESCQLESHASTPVLRRLRSRACRLAVARDRQIAGHRGGITAGGSGRVVASIAVAFQCATVTSSPRQTVTSDRGHGDASARSLALRASARSGVPVAGEGCRRAPWEHHDHTALARSSSAAH